MRVSTAGKGEKGEKHVERGSTLVNRKPARVLFCEAGADEKLDCAFNPLTVPFTRVFFSFQITNWTEESPPSLLLFFLLFFLDETVEGKKNVT